MAWPGSAHVQTPVEVGSKVDQMPGVEGMGLKLFAGHGDFLASLLAIFPETC